jgi:hypothetical protein
VSHFAHVNKDGIVDNVIVVEQDVIDSGLFGPADEWIKTSYNTHQGVHRLGETPLRGNFAGIGFYYDRVHDKFYQPQPYPSWTLNTTTWTWDPPTPRPAPTLEGFYSWSEDSKSWSFVRLKESANTANTVG